MSARWPPLPEQPIVAQTRDCTLMHFLHDLGVVVFVFNLQMWVSDVNRLPDVTLLGMHDGLY